MGLPPGDVPFAEDAYLVCSSITGDTEAHRGNGVDTGRRGEKRKKRNRQEKPTGETNKEKPIGRPLGFRSDSGGASSRYRGS